MKLTHYICSAMATLAALTACHNDAITPDNTPTYTVGEADNAIVLTAGISDGGSGVQTRAGADTHVPFSAQTQLRLRVDGTWTGHGDSPYLVSKKTTAKTAAPATSKQDGDTNDTHAVDFTDAEKLYWDDYGTADPANTSTGRVDGLTIYGVAVEGKSSAPEVSDWRALSWNVGTPDAKNIIDLERSGWGDYDLITSNNIKGDHRYTFDNSKASPVANNLLKFTHAMSKITVILTAADGFPEDNSVHQFQNTPTVNLLNFNYQGTVNIEEKISTPASSNPTVGIIKMHREGAATWTKANQATFTALVFPGNSWDSSSKATDILELNADGNVYKVTAEKLYDAINTAISSGHPGESNGTLALYQGYNYKIQITVKKTEIKVTATVVDWIDVEAEMVYPKIDVNMSPGSMAGSQTGNVYSFFISENKEKGYGVSEGTEPNTYYTANSGLSYSSEWNLSPQLYWPNHQTHYHMRGIYPQVGTYNESDKPIVVKANDKQYVAVQNSSYDSSSFPSNFMIGAPIIEDASKMCTSTTHDHVNMIEKGICATEGKVNLTFKYMMSKVQVSLKSTGTAGEGNLVTLSNEKVLVQIINGKNKANIRLSDGLHEEYTEGDKAATYNLSEQSPAETDFNVTTLDAIVPQELGNDVKLRITVTNEDSTTDVYEAQLNTINIKNVTPNQPIKEWEPGKYYHYQLDIKKTAIKVSATITDWDPVTAEDNVWF